MRWFWFSEQAKKNPSPVRLSLPMNLKRHQCICRRNEALSFWRSQGRLLILSTLRRIACFGKMQNEA
jgi:hypothetical protein